MDWILVDDTKENLRAQVRWVLPAHGQCLNTGSSRKNAYFYVVAEKGLATEAIWRPACDHFSCRHLGERPVAKARTN
jgi:hypothetical protein